MCVRLVVSVGAIAVVAAGCAAGPEFFPEIGQAVPEAFDKTTYFSTSFDGVWSSLITVLSERDFPFDLVEKESGLITTSWVQTGQYSTRKNWATPPDEIAVNAYVSCSVKDKHDIPHGTQCRLRIVVAAKDKGIAVTLNAKFQGWRGAITRDVGWDECNSTGVLEGEIIEAVREMLEQ